MLIKDIRAAARWLGVIFSGLSVLFAISVYLGVWNSWRGNDLAAAVAARFDKSYAEDASRPVRPADKEWSSVVRIIKKYSPAKLPTDRQPRVLARGAAVASFKDAAGIEWTAPTTPLALFYREWPTGSPDPIPPSDWVIVGTIGDLHNWIRSDAADFDYLVRTIIFGLLSVCIGVFLALPEKSKPDTDANSKLAA